MLGVLCRVDSSGLAVQTQLMVDLLNPDVVVYVDMGSANRGPVHRLNHPNSMWAPGQNSALTGQTVARFLRDCDTVWTAESLYWTSLPRRLRRTRICVTANPELWRPSGEANVDAVFPTVWHADGRPVVPHPFPAGRPNFDRVAAGNLARQGPARRVLHVAAPAMLDRNGTDPLLAALRLYRGPPFTLVVAGAGLPSTFDVPRRVGDVTVERLAPVVDHADMYVDADLYVGPRRYAGLHLPAGEAAAAGVPVLMSAVSPQDSWGGVDASIVCGRGEFHAMRGGRFRVAVPDPASIAARLAAYTSDDGSCREGWQRAASLWAFRGSWDHVAPSWNHWLRRP